MVYTIRKSFQRPCPAHLTSSSRRWSFGFRLPRLLSQTSLYDSVFCSMLLAQITHDAHVLFLLPLPDLAVRIIGPLPIVVDESTSKGYIRDRNLRDRHDPHHVRLSEKEKYNRGPCGQSFAKWLLGRWMERGRKTTSCLPSSPRWLP